MALFNKQHLKAVVLIERESNGKFESVATGYLVGFLVINDPVPAKRTYRIFLVTNRHVFSDQSILWLRFDKKEFSGTERFPVQLLNEKREPKWLAHKDPKVDLAMISINAEVLNTNNIDWLVFTEEMFAYPDKFEEIGVSLGDDVFVLGFPMGISGVIQNFAVVRKGTISRIDKEIINQNKHFLIDATIFPGNSGGPVLLKPEVSKLQNTKSVSSVRLLGTVSGYLTYREPLFSHQSNPPIIAAMSMENSGLANVVSMNFVREIYNDFLGQLEKLENVTTGEEKTIKA